MLMHSQWVKQMITELLNKETLNKFNLNNRSKWISEHKISFHYPSNSATYVEHSVQQFFHASIYNMI
jgi:hypothetical protein